MWVRKLPDTSGGKFEGVKAEKESECCPSNLADANPPDPEAARHDRNPTGEREMEEAATATAVEATAAAATEKTTSYRYWVREATGDAAPVPAPRKLDAADLAANAAPATLGSVWNQVSLLCQPRYNGSQTDNCFH